MLNLDKFPQKPWNKHDIINKTAYRQLFKRCIWVNTKFKNCKKMCVTISIQSLVYVRQQTHLLKIRGPWPTFSRGRPFSSTQWAFYLEMESCVKQDKIWHFIKHFCKIGTRLTCSTSFFNKYQQMPFAPFHFSEPPTHICLPSHLYTAGAGQQITTQLGEVNIVFMEEYIFRNQLCFSYKWEPDFSPFFFFLPQYSREICM